MSDLPLLDPTLHQPVRTRLAVLLASGPHSFSELKAELQVTDGNLDAHLRKFSGAGYLRSRFVHGGTRPHTLYSLSASGRKAWRDYVRAIRELIGQQKNR